MLLPALSRAEPEFFIRTSAGKARRKAAIPSAFFLFDEKQIGISISESVFLTLQISPPSSSLSFSGKGYAPYLNERRQAFRNSPFWAPGEHRLKHDWRGPSYAMRSIQKKASGKLQGLQKEGAFLCCTEKRTKEKTLFDFLSSSRARLSPARPALEGKISKAEKDRGRGSCILFSSRELQDRRSIRKGRGLHFVGRSRNDPIHSGLRGTQKRTLFTFFIDR